MPALAAARQARADAAGGQDRIVSTDDVDRLLMNLRTTDEQTLREARGERQRIGRERDRAEARRARAFAAAETRTAEHIGAQRDALATEMRVLDVAGRYQVARPLTVSGSGFAGLPDSTRAALQTLAELPFTVTPVRAAPSPERTAALHTLRATVEAAQRKVLWCARTHDGVERAEADELGRHRRHPQRRTPADPRRQLAPATGKPAHHRRRRQRRPNGDRRSRRARRRQQQRPDPARHLAPAMATTTISTAHAPAASRPAVDSLTGPAPRRDAHALA